MHSIGVYYGNNEISSYLCVASEPEPSLSLSYKTFYIQTLFFRCDAFKWTFRPLPQDRKMSSNTAPGMEGWGGGVDWEGEMNNKVYLRSPLPLSYFLFLECFFLSSHPRFFSLFHSPLPPSFPCAQNTKRAPSPLTHCTARPVLKTYWCICGVEGRESAGRGGEGKVEAVCEEGVAWMRGDGWRDGDHCGSAHGQRDMAYMP